MKNKSLFFILLLALIVPRAAQAQETLTVCDGTATNEYLPVYGFYMDTQGTTSEFIIPANTEGMSGMVGGTISKLTFYISGSPASWGSPTIQLYLGEVEGTTLSSVNGPSNFTVVKTMVWSNQQSTIEVEFDEPYTYGGGNLLIGTYVASTGSYKHTNFFGVSAPSGSGYCHYSSTNASQSFLPKTTFTYEAADDDCPKPNNFVASNVTAHTADLSWESDGFIFILQYKKASQSSWNEEWLYPEDNPIPYTLTGLTAETEYQARVAAIHDTCPTDPETGDHVQSDWREISFTTGIACFAPTNLAVTSESITAREATVTWEDTSDSYVVMIGEENLAVRADFETGDLSQADFTSTSDYPWTVVANTHSGAYCAKSGNGDVNYSTSELLLEVNLSTDMTLTFSAKVSSESDWDKAYFAIDGNDKINGISGNGNWIDYSYPLTAGPHTLRWYYTKDGSTAGNDDCFYVDDIVISAGVDSWTEYNANAQTYTFTNLTPNRPYLVKVKGNCGDEGYSQETAPVRFTTLESCFTPTDLTASNVTTHEATISWTSAADAWQICVNDDEENLIDVTETTYNFTGLAPETTYTVKVRTNCGNEYSDWTNNMDFTTGIACFAPTNLAVAAESITAREATVTWEGTSNNYVVMIGEENIAVRADFEDQTIPAAFTNTGARPWYVTAGGANGSGYCAIPGNQGASSSESDLTLEVTLDNPATVSFNAKVSSEDSYDWGRFFIDGTQMMQISGIQDWTAYSYELAAGTHTLIWRFAKDSGVNDNNDLFYVDDIIVSTGVASWTEYDTNAQTYTFENLTPNRPYQVKVKGNCGDEGYSQASAPVRFTTLESCVTPTGLAVSNITGHEATINWTSAAEAWQICVNDDEENLIDVTETTYNFTGLAPETAYTVKVRANCGDDGYSDWTDNVSFNTYVACPAPTVVTATEVSGYTAKLNWTGHSESYTVSYRATIYKAANRAGEWETVSVDEPPCILAGLTPETTYEAKVQGDCGDDGLSLETYITFTTDVACPAPTGLTVSNITGHKATISWTSAADDWQICVNDDEEHLIDVTENTYTLTGLTPETAYTVKVRANCGDDGYSDWTNNVSFTTDVACPAPTNLTATNVMPTSATLNWEGDAESFEMKYAVATTYDFEDGTFQGWTNLLVNADGGQWYNSNDQTGGYDYSTCAHSGTQFVVCYSYLDNVGAYTTDAYLVSPNSYQIGENASLNFWYDFANDSYPEYTEVCIATVANPTASDFTAIWNSGSAKGGGIIREANAKRQRNTRYENWREVTLDLSAYAGQSIWIAFHDVNYDQYEVWIDDIFIDAGDAQNWTTIENVTSPYTLSDLDPETAYMVCVRANCGEDGESEWSSIVTFSTPEGYTKTIEAHSAEGEEMSGWYLIASPLYSSISVDAVDQMTDNQFDLYRFNQAPTVNDEEEYLEWENYKKHTTDFLIESGIGYLYANSGNVTLTFTGEAYEKVNPYDKMIVLSNTEDNPDENMRGWNLVGNPYSVKAYPRRDFYVMNPDGNDIVTPERNYIEPMEGAFVYAEQNGEELTFYKSESSTGNKGALSINVVKASNHRGNGLIDRAVVRFGEGNVLPKFMLNQSHTKVYIPQGNKDCAVVYSEGQGEMPLNFRANENGTYTLSFNAEEVSFSYLHLIDNMTGMDVDLLQAPSYTFNATTTDYSSRFKLVFATGSNNDSDNFAFFSNGNWIIGNEGEATLQVIDVTGRILSSETVNGSVSKAINAAPGVYMLRLINGENVKVQKIVVR